MEKIDKYNRYRTIRNRRFFIAFIGAISITTSILFFTITHYVSDLFLLSYRFVIILGLILFIMGLGALFSVYLKSVPLHFYRGIDDYEDFDLNSIFNYHLKKNFIDKYGSQYKRYDKPEIQEILFENDLESFKQKYILQAKHDLEFAHLFDEFNKLENKFKIQIERLISNSNLNLIIGIVTTLLAIIILGSSILTDKSFTNNIDFFSFFIPRVSTVIFVELFSFFFLRLYKSNLSEIKYFQNEITNLSFKITSLKTAIKLDDRQTIGQIINNFSLTERNFVLKKNETTERIETAKLENIQSSNFSTSITELIKTVKK